MTAPTIRDGITKGNRPPSYCFTCGVSTTKQPGFSAYCVEHQATNRAQADHRLGFFCGTCRTHFTRESGLRKHQGGWHDDERPGCPLRGPEQAAEPLSLPVGYQYPNQGPKTLRNDLGAAA